MKGYKTQKVKSVLIEEKTGIILVLGGIEIKPKSVKFVSNIEY